MSSAFQTHMQAEVRVPQDGFTLEDLKAHLRATKIPASARLRPALVRVDVEPERGGEVAFIAEWEA